MLKKKGINRFAASADIGRRHVQIDGQLEAEYPLRLNFYLIPPTAEITIEEFEQFALDRLQVLKSIETARLRNMKDADLAKEMNRVLENHLHLRSNQSRSPQLYNERRKDHISHFVLRLAYCRSEELREWFLRQECALFRHRFEQESTEDKKRFLTSLDLHWKIIDAQQKQEMAEQLELCSNWIALKHKVNVHSYVTNETFFEVDFEKVTDLVARRSVHVANGKAYVPMSEQISMIMDEFRNHLARALEATSKALPRMEEDDRLKPILLNVEKQYVGQQYDLSNVNQGSVRANDVDALVMHHAPLCMRHLHESLRHDKHLRHGGRLQYGLFLKGIGLSIEDALVFWRAAFANMTDDKFQKEHAYNIRHNYGLEGKRANYSPFHCESIIKGNPPSTGDHHGCPFRHFSQHNLEARFLRDGLSPANATEIMNLVQGQHYQVACTRYFELTHPNYPGDVPSITHPNEYFELSRGASNPDPEPQTMETDD